ncbi:MAG: hypothetical protein K8J31_17600 [Anaerolineae bacterium]|nr:hypothetical protein [Anaerolineae bacterium]
MRLSLVGLCAAFLFLAGLRPDSLPFIPEARFSDAAVTHWPAAAYLRASVLERGEFPSWQTTILGGQPFAANPLNKTAYPLQWLVLILPPALHLNVLILLHLLLAGWGMWRWTRHGGLSDAAALCSALAYAFAPKVLAHIGAGHVDLLYALAWWPWLMDSVQQGLTENEVRPVRTILQTSLFAALMFLADVRLSLFGLVLAAGCGVWETRRQARWSRLIYAVPVVALFGLLTLSVTVPLLGWQPYLSRSTMTAADAGVFALEGGQFVGLLLPPRGGNPETLTYLGLPVLLLAGVALFSAPRRYAFWWIAILLAALYAMGTHGPLWPVLVETLPLLRWFRVPARAWFVVVLAASWLAGHGLESVMRMAVQVRRDGTLNRLAILRLAAAGGMGAAVFCGAFTLALLTDLPAAIGIGVMMVGALLGVTLLLTLYGRLTPKWVAMALTLVVFFDLAWSGHGWLEWRGPDRWLTPQQALVEALQAETPTRIYSPNYALEQQTAAANGFSLFYGVDPFQLSGVVNAIAQGSGVPVAAYSVVLPPLDLTPAEDDARSAEMLLRTANQDAVLDTEVLAEWGVSHVVATYPILHNHLELRSEVDGDYLYANLDADPPAELNGLGWPNAGWPGLPDEATVAQLNQQTTVAAGVASLSLIICMALLVWGIFRR